MGTNTTGGTNDRASNVKRVKVEVDENTPSEEIELLKKIRGYGDATFVGVEVNVTSVNQRSDNAEEEYVQAGNQAQINVKEAGKAIAAGVTLVTTNTPKAKDPKKEAARRAAAKKAADKEAAKDDRGDN